HEGRIEWVNSAYTNMTGYTVQEVKSDYLSILKSGNHPAEFYRQMWETLLAGKIWRGELLNRRKDGTVYDQEMTITPVRGQDGRVNHFVAIKQDVTERRRHEQRLQAERNLLHALMDNLPDAIYFKDTHSRFTLINAAQARNLGLNNPLEAMGRTDMDFFPPHDARQKLTDERRVLNTGEPIVGAVENYNTAEGAVWWSVTKVPIRDASGKITGLVGVTRDITTIKAAEAERQKLDHRLLQAQKLEAIGTLAGGIAHDFNNILAAMIGYAELVKEDTVEMPATHECAREILLATKRAKDLVHQILTFSRQRETHPQVIHLDTVIKEVLKFLRSSLPSLIQIEKHLDAACPAVLADPTQIYQVVLNLASNSLHAMEGKAGTLTLRLEGLEPNAESIKNHPDFQPDRPYVRLTVADTGHGMDAKTLARVFEPFFTTKPIGKGTGLGLAMVHGIVKSHQGIVTVESTPQTGTTFQIFIPASQQAADREDNDSRPLPTGQGQTILLVDDEPALTQLFRRVLTRLNYKPISTNSPREAVELLRLSPDQFHLAITDYTMPELNGLEVAREWHILRPHLPIIMTSGYSAELNKEQLTANGIQHLLTKPVDMFLLAEVLQRLLPATSHPNGSDATLAQPQKLLF
ncbi:MAG TPA: PAS domain S-box protein, partial [Verrucomicrobiae bacterium]